MAEQEKEPADVPDVEEEEDNPNYKPPAPKALSEIVSADAEDESLRKYKETLLGQNTKEAVIIDASKGKVIVDKMTLLPNDRDPMYLDLTKPAEELKKSSFTLKEGCYYRITITFYAQKEIVTGLMYQHKVFRKGIKLTGMKHMMGSYAPSLEAYTFTTPEEEAPQGMLSRGEYKIKCRFVDDDKVEYLNWEFNLSVKKDW